MPEVWVLYYFQGELGESEDMPNAFSIQTTAPAQLSLRETLAYFPVADTHDLVFRVKASDDEHGYVWMDVSSDADPLPRSRNGEVWLKVLRIDEDSVLRRKTHLRRKEGRHTLVPSKQTSPRPSVQTSPRPSVERVSPTSKPRQFEPQEEPSRETVHESMKQSMNSSMSSSATDEDLVDFGSFVQAAPPVSAASSVFSAPPLSREELVKKRLDDVQDRVDTALKFKHDLDDGLKREAEELDDAKQKHDARLTVWAYNGSEKRNVRSLLSTLHTVTWPDCKWKPVGLGDLIEAKQVKLQYRKAMLVVHPDRCSGLSSEVHFIAKRIFEAVNEAFQDFLKKENP